MLQHVSVLHSFFFLMAKQYVYYSIVWLYRTLFIHFSGDGHWVVSTSLAIMNNAAINSHTQGFMWIYVFFFLGLK